MGGVMIALPTTPRYKDKTSEPVVAHQRSLLGGGDGLFKQPASSSMDSAPHYISPMLLRLIASNAPLELHVFSDLMQKSKLCAKRKRIGGLKRPGRRPLEDPVEALLATVRQYNKAAEAQQQGRQQEVEVDRPKDAKLCSRGCCRDRKGYERPSSARDDKRVKEARVVERPLSAREGSAAFEAGKSRARRNLSAKTASPRDCELQNALRLFRKEESRPPTQERRRPASAGPLLRSERAKPVWFKKASVKALEALEKNLSARLNHGGGEEEPPSRKSRPCSTDMGDSRPRSRRSDSGDRSSRSSVFGKRHDLEQRCKESPYIRPVTAPSLVSRASAPPRAETARIRKTEAQHTAASPRKKSGPREVSCVPDEGVSLDTTAEAERCVAAPVLQCSPMKPEQVKPQAEEELSEVDEELANGDDNFKDYIENGMKLSDEFGSTCSSDIDFDDDDYEVVELQSQEEMEVVREIKEDKNLEKKLEEREQAPPVKLDSSTASENGLKELVTGVHKSLLASSKLAEVVDMCSKRGQELLRARETMDIDKTPEKFRWPFAKFHRSRQSRASRRALRAELKWSIFANGGNKLKALSAIYGGRRFIREKLGALRGERIFEAHTYRVEPNRYAKRPPRRPATAPKRSSRREETEPEKSSAVAAVAPRNEAIGPWTPTPEMSESRHRCSLPPRSQGEHTRKMPQKKQDLENSEELLEQQARASNSLDILTVGRKKASPRPITSSPRSFRGWTYRNCD